MGFDMDDVIDTNNFYCKYANEKRDCDGDLNTYCMKYGYCNYKKEVIDCDGDTISFCYWRP